MVKGENISFRIGNRFLLAPTSLFFEPGRFHVIMGANGAGKSTLLKILAGHQKPASGAVFMREQSVQSFTKGELAQQRAILSQHYQISFPITVSDMVLMGRYPHFRNKPSSGDIAICKRAMQRMEVNALEHRDYGTLSGGEAQKVQMSRVLAQIWPEGEGAQKVLFLDEPVSHLDLRYQHQLLKVAKELCAQSVTVIAVLHDVNLALSYADRILFMKGGAVVYDVSFPAEVTAGMIQDVFAIEAQVLQLGNKGKRVVVF